MYEDLTEHLGFLRSSDEYKVMALASYGEPRFLDELREHVRATGDGGFAVAGIDWGSSRRHGNRTASGPATTPTSPPASRRASKRCCWT